MWFVDAGMEGPWFDIDLSDHVGCRGDARINMPQDFGRNRRMAKRPAIGFCMRCISYSMMIFLCPVALVVEFVKLAFDFFATPFVIMYPVCKMIWSATCGRFAGVPIPKAIPILWWLLKRVVLGLFMPFFLTLDFLCTLGMKLVNPIYHIVINLSQIMRDITEE